MMLRALTALASPSGRRARLSAFMFHRVTPAPDPLFPSEPDAARFDRMIGWISEQFRVLAPREACERLSAGRLPARAAIITFDDGYRDNAEVALPILQRRGLRAAFFIATGFLDGGAMFNDRIIEAVRVARDGRVRLDRVGLAEIDLSDPNARRQAISRLLAAVKHQPPERRLRCVEAIEERLGAGQCPPLMMRIDHLHRLRDAGMEIGGHTRTHPILAVLGDAQARAEIAGGRDDLRAILGESPVMFAYPNGRRPADYLGRHADMVRQAGFQWAFTTEPGCALVATPRFELPRYTPWNRTGMGYKLAALAMTGAAARRLRPGPVSS